MKLLILLILVSCSTSTHIIKQNELLPYKESSQVTKVVEDLSPLKINQILDRRDKIELGFAFTGVKYQKTPINLNIPLKDYLKGYFVNGLEMRNISVVDQSLMLMDIEINEVWVQEVIEKFKPERAKCQVDMTFHINAPNSKWSGNFRTEFTSAGDLSDGTERVAPTLASCLNALLEKLVTDDKLITLLKVNK